MKKLENIEFTAPFQQACDIFELSAEKVIQQFINSVDLAVIFSDPLQLDRWANLFVLESVVENLEPTFLERYEVLVDEMTKQLPASPGERIDRAREIMDKWHKAVLEDRIDGIMNQDEGSDE